MDRKALLRLERELRATTPFQKLMRHPLRVPLAEWWKRKALRREEAIYKTARLFWGDEMIVVIPDYISLRLYKYGYYEDHLTKAYLEFLKPGMTYVDVGAHFGYTCLLAAHIVGSTGKIYAFEPTPRTYDILSKNLCHLGNCKVENVAAYSKTTSLDFVDFGAERPALNSLFGGKTHDIHHASRPLKHITVEATRLDDYIDRHRLNVDFIKIDTEGAESCVLQGLKNTLANHRPIVSIEVDDRHSMPNVPPSCETVAWIASLGYRPLEYLNNRFESHEIRREYRLTNLYLVPK